MSGNRVAPAEREVRERAGGRIDRRLSIVVSGGSLSAMVTVAVDGAPTS